MADRKTGIADAVNIIRESDSTDITDELGIIVNVSWSINLPENPRSSVGKAPTLQAAVEQPAEVGLTMELEINDFRAFKLFGTFTDNGDGTYDVKLDDKLPEFTAKLEVTNNEDNLELTGLKFLGPNNLTISTGDAVNLTLEAQGKDADLLDENITQPDPADPSQPLDAYLKLGGNDVASVDSATITYDRSQGPDAGPNRGLKNANADNRRQPDEIIEGNKFFDFDSTVEITDKQAFEETFNSTSQPFGIEDATSRTTATIVINDGDDNFELTDAKITENTGELTNEAGEIRTVDLSGNSFDASISGNT